MKWLFAYYVSDVIPFTLFESIKSQSSIEDTSLHSKLVKTQPSLPYTVSRGYYLFEEVK